MPLPGAVQQRCISSFLSFASVCTEHSCRRGLNGGLLSILCSSTSFARQRINPSLPLVDQCGAWAQAWATSRSARLTRWTGGATWGPLSTSGVPARLPGCVLTALLLTWGGRVGGMQHRGPPRPCHPCPHVLLPNIPPPSPLHTPTTTTHHHHHPLCRFQEHVKAANVVAKPMLGTQYEDPHRQAPPFHPLPRCLLPSSLCLLQSNLPEWCTDAASTLRPAHPPAPPTVQQAPPGLGAAVCRSIARCSAGVQEANGWVQGGEGGGGARSQSQLPS